MALFSNKVTIKQKQQYLILGALAVLGILMLCIGNGSDADTASHASTIEVGQAYGDDIVAMEHKLSHTLSQIQGAGNVTVQITTKSSGRKEYAVDKQHTSRTTVEESADSTQHTTELQEQQNVVQQNRSGAQEALLIEETAPEIAGVLVVASGASDALIQERLLHAVAALMQLPLHQIMVVPGEEAF